MVSKPRSVPSNVPLPEAPTASPNTLVTSTVGAAVSRVTLPLAVPVPPLPPETETVMALRPSVVKPSAGSQVPLVAASAPVSTDQAPLPSVMAVKVTPAMVRVTGRLGWSLVPLMVGVVSVVTPSVLLVPVSLVMLVMATATGDERISSGTLAGALMLPAGSVAVTTALPAVPSVKA